jgi:drug/metabolite transporter (DMT)-like permease
VAVAVGIIVALSFGSGDFFGGLASRRTPAITVVTTAQLGAALCALVASIAFSASALHASDLWVGCAAGAFNAVGVALLYYGLAGGRMAVVAPVTAALSATIPVAWALSTGERPASLALAGVALAVAGAALVGTSPDHGSAEMSVRRSVLVGCAASACFGTSFVAYATIGNGAGNWPVLVARLVAFTMSGAAVLVSGAPVRPAPGDRRPAIAAGLLDGVASVLLLVALRRGLASLVAPVAALGPAATVALARVVLGEHIGPRQRFGLAVAAAGVVLIASG